MSYYARDFHSQFKFPSGRSVKKCLEESKQFKKKSGLTLAQCLDKVAKENGIPGGWSCAIRTLSLSAQESILGAGSVMSQDDLERIVANHPTLTQHGFGFLLREDLSDNESEAELRRQNNLMRYDLQRYNETLAFTSLLRPQANPSAKCFTDSYELKHIAERSLSRIIGRGTYVSHGDLIVTALFRGFLYKKSQKFFSMAVVFNIDEDSPILHWNGSANDPVGRQLQQMLITSTGLLGLSEEGDLK